MLYYYDIENIYLGAFDESLPAPNGSVSYTEIAPSYANQIWNGTVWEGAAPFDLGANTDALAFQMLYNNAPWELFSLFPLFKFYGAEATPRMSCWAVIKSQSPAWLTQEWATNMEAYCAEVGMPLVP